MGQVSISGNNFDVYSETANAESDANTYLLGKINAAAWRDSEERKQALVSATRWVERALTARLVDSSSIPNPSDTPAPTLIAQATYEAAFVLVSNPTALDAQNQGDNKKRLKAEGVEIEFFRPQSGAILPATAQALLIQWIDSLGAVSNFGALASGTDGESEFCDQDLYGRQEGFP